MENMHQLVARVAALWNMHQCREVLYKQSMTLDNLGSLRKICSQGFISSLLFQKDIQWIYDDIKCALSDGDIHNFVKEENVPLYTLPNENRAVLTRIIQDQEYKSIKLYKELLGLKNLTTDTYSIFTDHLDKLSDISYHLNKELTKYSPRHFALQMTI